MSLRSPIEQALALGPAPHPYRRIKQENGGFVLAYKEWRLPFEVHAERVIVTSVRSGYRPSEVFVSGDPKLLVHRAFLERFGS